MVFRGSKIKGELQYNSVDIKKTALDLGFAKIGSLGVIPDSWPDRGNLYLNGLVYNELFDHITQDAKTLISFLNLQPSDKYYPQPYEQMAKVLKANGREEDAKEILIEKNRIRLERVKLKGLEKSWLRFIGAVMDYGHRPLKTVWFILALLAFGVGFFYVGFNSGVMVPTGTKPIPKDYPIYSAVVYSIDTFVPILDMRQSKHYRPDATAHGAFDMGEGFFMPVHGYVILIYFWIHILAGWILTTIFIVGLTGAIKQ